VLAAGQAGLSGFKSSWGRPAQALARRAGTMPAGPMELCTFTNLSLRWERKIAEE